MYATVILYMLFLLLKLFFPTFLYHIDPNDLPKLGLNINLLRGFYYHFPSLLPPPHHTRTCISLASKPPLHSSSLYKSQKHLAVDQRLMFLFHSVELLPESGCLATASHEPVWLSYDKQLVDTTSNLGSKNLPARHSSVLFPPSDEGRQRIQERTWRSWRSLEPWGLLSQHLTTLKQEGNIRVCGELLEGLRLFAAAGHPSWPPSTLVPQDRGLPLFVCLSSVVCAPWGGGQESHPHFTGFAFNGV